MQLTTPDRCSQSHQERAQASQSHRVESCSMFHMVECLLHIRLHHHNLFLLLSTQLCRFQQQEQNSISVRLRHERSLNTLDQRSTHNFWCHRCHGTHPFLWEVHVSTSPTALLPIFPVSPTARSFKTSSGDPFPYFSLLSTVSDFFDEISAAQSTLKFFNNTILPSESSRFGRPHLVCKDSVDVQEEACENLLGILLFRNRAPVEMLALCLLGSFLRLGTLFGFGEMRLSFQSSPFSPDCTTKSCITHHSTTHEKLQMFCRELVRQQNAQVPLSSHENFKYNC